MSKEFQIRDGNLIASFDLENEDGDINFCKLLKVSHGVADEIGMFVDYVATNKIIKGQSKQISDLEAKLAEQTECSLKASAKHNLEMQNAQICIKELEAKLAESEKQKQHYKDWLDDVLLTSVDHESYYSTINEYEEENKYFKQQLAEKEREIEKITKIVAYRDNMDMSTVINGVKFSDEQIITLQNIDYFADKHNQDKTSFAVEQLEKVKEFCNNPKNRVEYEYCPNAWTYAVDKDKLMLEIDNQIEELKKGMK